MRARVVVNAAGVWADDVRALDEGTHPASIRPAKGIHITVPWSKVRNDIAAIVPVPRRQALGVRGAVGRHHLRRHHRHRLRRPARRPAVHARRRRLPARAPSTASPTSSSPSPTWSGRGPACGPLLRNGRSAPAPPTSRAGTRCARRRAAWSPSPAASSPPTGAWRPTRSTPRSRSSVERGRPSRTKHLRLFGGEGLAPPVAALEPSAHEHLTGRYGTEAEAVLAPRRRRSRPRRAARARPAVPAGRGALRGAPRDGAHARRRALSAHAGAAPGSRRVGGRGGRRGRPPRGRPRLVARGTRRRRSPGTAPRSPPNAAGDVRERRRR